jgi:hypothetical protein
MRGKTITSAGVRVIGRGSGHPGLLRVRSSMIIAIAGLEPDRFAQDETGTLVRADIDHRIDMLNIR